MKDRILTTLLIIFAIALLVVLPFYASYPKTYIPCDTDMDCLEKNGCGGYADPCEVSE